MNNTIALAFLSADDRMTWFCDDDRCTDREEYFDAYAFQVWNDEQHNEKDCQQTLAEYANAVRFLPKFRDDEKEAPRCDCHRYGRYCGICRPY
jgi:hypothetical protein